MIHGKWYKGSDNLSVLERDTDETDKISWHLVIEEDGIKQGMCALTPFENSFIINRVKADAVEILELMLRMISVKIKSFNKETIYAKKNSGITGFGFAEYNNDTLIAKKIILPNRCKE